jgi:hypothetical protein
MKNRILDIPNSFHNVRRMLRGIPQQIWYIFLPESDDNLPMLEADIAARRLRDIERDKVMAIQKACGFPLRPNEPLTEVTARARIQSMKNGAGLDGFGDDYPQ